MKTLIKLSVIASGLALASSALAAMPGWYVGGNVGWSKMAIDTGNIDAYAKDKGFSLSGDAIKQSTQVGGGIQGGYNFAVAPRFLLGLEANVQYLGQIKAASNGTQSGSIWNLDGDSVNRLAVTAFVTGHYEVMPKIDLFAKAGATYQNGKDQATLTINNKSYTHYLARNSSIVPVVAAGFGYQLTPNWEVFAQYEHVFGSTYDADYVKGNSKKAITNNSVTVGFNYYFGGSSNTMQ